MKGVLCEKVAKYVSRLIDSGALRPGQRALSVRALARQMRVSTATVVEAFSLLEARGLVEARARSGHYVRETSSDGLDRPRVQRMRLGAIRVNGDRMRGLFRSMRDRSVVPFGASCPSPDLLPTDRLARLTGAIARSSPAIGAVYDPLPGVSALRAHIARRATRHGCAVRPDDVIVTVGAIEAIGLSLRATTRPGDTVAVESPTYFGVLALLAELGLSAVEVPAATTEGLQLDALRAALEKHDIKACVAVPNFSNPCGARMPDDAKEQLVALLARRRVPLIETDVYGDLPHDDDRPRPAKAFDPDGWVMHCSSFSKSLAPGYRVGWVVPGRFYERVEELKFMHTVASPTITQMAIAAFLDSGGYERHLRTLRRAFAAQVSAAQDAIARHFPRGTRVSRPSGGYLLWVELPEGSPTAIDIQRAALERAISIAPGPIFSARGSFQRFFRLSCGYPWSDSLDDAVEVLGRLANGKLTA
jgi:DNA-binding transcriptional MocR family regulator